MAEILPLSNQQASVPLMLLMWSSGSVSVSKYTLLVFGKAGAEVRALTEIEHSPLQAPFIADAFAIKCKARAQRVSGAVSAKVCKATSKRKAEKTVTRRITPAGVQVQLSPVPVRVVVGISAVDLNVEGTAVGTVETNEIRRRAGLREATGRSADASEAESDDGSDDRNSHLWKVLMVMRCLYR